MEQGLGETVIKRELEASSGSGPIHPDSVKMDPLPIFDIPSYSYLSEEEHLSLIEALHEPSNNQTEAITDNLTVPTQENVLSDGQLATTDESGTEEERLAFLNELQKFYAQRGLEFKVPKFYGQPLNCLKLWRLVSELGGYDKIESKKLWRKVGNCFNPPETFTTVASSFHGYYRKPSSGRVSRDSACHARERWNSIGVIGDKKINMCLEKDNNSHPSTSGQKTKKKTGLNERKEATNALQPDAVCESEQLRSIKSDGVTMVNVSVEDIGIRSDWVRINVMPHRHSFEVYMVVPGFSEDELKVQPDPNGKLVITGRLWRLPINNRFGIRPFQKVVHLPRKIIHDKTQATFGRMA